MPRALVTSLLTATAFVLLACGGPQIEAPPPEKTKVQEAEEAIAIIRNSFDAMGGLQRLRLAGGKVKIVATGTADGQSVPVEITVGGPARFRMDYPLEDTYFVHDKGECRKIAYGISSRCTRGESNWTTPVRVLSGLTFPAGDAAKLNSTFRMREDTTINGKSCVVPEIRPKNTNLKIRAAYDKATGLLAQASFYFKDNEGNKDHWSVTYDDWREVKKMMVPFRRTVANNGRTIWDETATSVDFDSFDERAFLAPLPPTTDQPLPFTFPARRFAEVEVEGEKVQMPAPYPAVGGGWIPGGPVSTADPSETVRIVHRGPVEKATRFFEQLKGGAMTLGRKTEGEPAIILLEEPDGPESPALMILYTKIVKQAVSVDISM